MAKNCCLQGLYVIGWIFVNLCPGIAQIRALYILCNHSNYLGSNDSTDRSMAHVSLIMNTYIVGYLFARLVIWYFQAWNYCVSNHDKGIYPKIGIMFLSLGTYTIYLALKLYFKIWEFGVKNRKGNRDNDIFDIFFANIGLLIVSFGTYILFLLLELYFKLWKYGIKERNNTKWAHLVLTIVSFGTYLIYWFIESWCRLYNYGNSLLSAENTCERWNGHIIISFTTLGLYVIGKMLQAYGNAFDYGYKKVTAEKISDILIGDFVLTIITLGLYIPFRLIWLYIILWRYAGTLKGTSCKYFAQCLIKVCISLGLYFIYLYFRLWKYGLQEITEETNHRLRKLALFFASFGLYSFVMIFDSYVSAWNWCIKKINHKPNKAIPKTYETVNTDDVDVEAQKGEIVEDKDTKYESLPTENTGLNGDVPNDAWKGHLGLVFLTLGLYLPYLLIKHYCIIMHEMVVMAHDKDIKKAAYGHSICLLLTLGLWIIYLLPYLFVKAIIWLVKNTTSDVFWKRHLSQTILGLVVFKIYYELWRMGLFYVYENKKEENNEKMYWFKYVCGFLMLTMATVGLYIVFRLILLYFDACRFLFDAARDKENGTCKKITCHIILSIITLSLYSTGMYIFHAFYTLDHLRYKDPESDQFQDARFKSYFLFPIISFMYWNYYSESTIKKIITRIIVIIMVFLVIMIPIYVLDHKDVNIRMNISIWSIIAILVPILFELFSTIFYSNSARFVMYRLMIIMFYGMRRMRYFGGRYIVHPMNIGRIGMINGFRRMGRSISNLHREMNANYRNREYNPFVDSITQNDPKFARYEPLPEIVPRVAGELKTWETVDKEYHDSQFIPIMMDIAISNIVVARCVNEEKIRKLYNLTPTKYQNMMIQRMELCRENNYIFRDNIHPSRYANIKTIVDIAMQNNHGHTMWVKYMNSRGKLCRLQRTVRSLNQNDRQTLANSLNQNLYGEDTVDIV